MKKSKIITSIFLCIILSFSTMPLTVFAGDNNTIAANWKFDEKSVKSGSIENNDLVISDLSGNGNDIYLTGKDASKYIEFSDEKMYNETTGSLMLNNEKQRILGKGVEFLTSKNAKINKENFENGYTIELIYQLPKDFSADDAWMGLLARKGNCETQTDTKKCTMSVAVSNCKEIQFLTANKDDSHKMDSTWSLTMDKGGLWYHIVIVSDGKIIRTFVNGCESFRDYESNEMIGMYADSNDGRFVIGGYNSGIHNHFGRGTLQQIRIANIPLEKSQWLISDHENYVEDFGVNLPFTKSSVASYNVMFLPDIQNAVEFKPNVLYTAAKWIKENKSSVNLTSIISLGDNVNDFDDEKQWNNAKQFYSILEECNSPILQQPGNHDYGEEYYLNAFGNNSDFGKRQTERGVIYSPSGYSSYIMFDGGSYKYLAVNISMYHIDDKKEREWFENVLKEHPNNPTIVTSHNFQDVDAAVPNLVNLSKLGKDIWQIVKKYNQVFMMISGHNHGAGEEVLKNDAGNEVYSVMADYQFMHNGGNAFFKFADFDEVHNKIHLTTFSPYAVTLSENERTFFDVNYMTGLGNYTVIDFNFTHRFNGFENSDNAEEYKAIIENTKSAEPEPNELNLDGMVTLSINDAHEVTNKMGTLEKTIIKIVVPVITVILIITVVLIIIISNKKKRKIVK